MNARRVVAALLCAALAGTLGPALATAQVAADPASPAACTKSVSDWRAAQVAAPLDAYRKATDSTSRAALLAKYTAANTAATAGAQKMAADCAAKFTVATIPPAQLMDLITLYTAARDTTNARLATERLLSSPDLPPRARGQALTLAMSQEITKASAVFGILDGAEAVIAKIDALPDSLSDMKLAAHRTMLSRYDYLDVAEGLHKHAIAVIALAKQLNRPSDMIAGYSLLARSYADRLHPDSALRILNDAEKDLGAPATTAFKAFRERYALIGTPASAISAQWWINPDAKMVMTPAAGKVTLIEFTAHWCGPCKNSYPGLRSVAEHFKGKGFEGVMVTSLYGYLGDKKNLTPDQEVAADREYFGKEHSLPFPVAINPQRKSAADPAPKPDTNYLVSGIPQIIIVDKKGIIRQIVTGWDQGNTARFTTLIDGLLKEK